jgi:uncharacterized protein
MRTTNRNGMDVKRLFAQKLIIVFLIVSGTILTARAQNIPARPNPPRLVNDFTATLSKSQIQQLETKLVDYNDSTSTQIVVVLVSDLGNYEAADFAYKLGESWGVGRKGQNNGAVVLIKPKTERSRGKAFIATGYGLEGVIPDALARRIVEVEMIPSFMENNYYEGIDKALNTMFSLASGAFTSDEYLNPQQEAPSGAWFVPIIIIAIIFLMMKLSRSNNHIGNNKNLPLWTALWLASQAGKSHGGSWGSFSGGSRGFGGGGFGGFGGGSFGGGGAGGSW